MSEYNRNIFPNMSEFNKKLLSVVMGLLIITSMAYAAKEAASLVSGIAGASTSKSERSVVVDAGHGGRDPGKVGVNGALEKDINLNIAKRLKIFLEENDINVVMTREEDKGLYDESASNKKVQDMKRRVALIEEVYPVLIVSIHQNSYQNASVSGAQVFYYSGSTEGKKLAEYIQKQLIDKLGEENVRQIKANDSYYLLKKTKIPTVIVECGFLSNLEEAEKLEDSVYQEKIAWAIQLGIQQYRNK